MSVFVDTSALYALLVATDEHHAAVVAAFRRVVGARRELVTSSYVLVETVALLQSRLGLAAVRELAESFVPLLRVEWVSEILHRRGFERLLREDRRRLSLVDCVSLELMAAQRLSEVLAVDPHFEQAGHRVLPVR